MRRVSALYPKNLQLPIPEVNLHGHHAYHEQGHDAEGQHPGQILAIHVEASQHEQQTGHVRPEVPQTKQV